MIVIAVGRFGGETTSGERIRRRAAAVPSSSSSAAVVHVCHLTVGNSRGVCVRVRVGVRGGKDGVDGGSISEKEREWPPLSTDWIITSRADYYL